MFFSKSPIAKEKSALYVFLYCNLSFVFVLNSLPYLNSNFGVIHVGDIVSFDILLWPTK